MRTPTFLAALLLAATTPAVTVLNVNMVKGYVTVSINGQKVGRYGKSGPLDRTGNPIVTVDVSRYVREGRNALKVDWNGGKPVGVVRVSESLDGGYRKVGELRLDVMARESGSRTSSFNIGGARGGGPAFGTPRPGSADRQALLTANIVRGDVQVFVNGRKVGSYAAGLVPIDISDYARPGANTLRLAWTGGRPTGSVRVSYAAHRNAFRTIAQYDLNVFTKRNSGGTVTFRLP